jgi:hypothetical protein
MHGPTCIFWANLTPFSLAKLLAEHLARTLVVLDIGGLPHITDVDLIDVASCTQLPTGLALSSTTMTINIQPQ